MATPIRIKRRDVTGGSGAPASLHNAELAFGESDRILWYGFGTGGEGGTATLPIAIAGEGAYLALASGITQTAAGSYTFSGSVALGSSATANTPSSSDNSTSVATTAFVKAQGYQTSNASIELTGDAVGTGATEIAVTISSNAVTNAKLADMASGTIKGRTAAGAGDPEDLTVSDVKSLLALTHDDISDFDTGVRQNRLDQMAVPTSDVSVNNHKITNVAAPTADTDCANKAYVDGARAGLDIKASVRAATTTNVSLSGEQSIDGVSLSAGDRVLVKNQSNASENGIYVVAAGSWSRASDANSSANLTAGAFTFVEGGAVNGDTGWVVATDGSIDVGTTPVTFSKFTQAGEVTAGDGLSKTGSVLSALGTANRVSVSASGIDIASTYAGQSSISTVGTLTSGALGAGFSTIGVARGGTGLTSFTKGSVIVANEANVLSSLDGGGAGDRLLVYASSTDTVEWAAEIDGGVF